MLLLWMEPRILPEFRRTNLLNALRCRKASKERRHYHHRRRRLHRAHLTLHPRYLHPGDLWIADGKFLHLRLHQRPLPRHLQLLAIRVTTKTMLRPLIRQEAKRSGLATTQMQLKQAADRLNFVIVLGISRRSTIRELSPSAASMYAPQAIRPKRGRFVPENCCST